MLFWFLSDLFSFGFTLWYDSAMCQVFCFLQLLLLLFAPLRGRHLFHWPWSAAAARSESKRSQHCVLIAHPVAQSLEHLLPCFQFSIVSVSCRHTFTAANACLWHNIWHSVLCHVGQQHGITLRAGANMQRRRCMPSCVTRAWQNWRNWKFWFIPMIPICSISLRWW